MLRDIFQKVFFSIDFNEDLSNILEVLRIFRPYCFIFVHDHMLIYRKIVLAHSYKINFIRTTLADRCHFH